MLGAGQNTGASSQFFCPAPSTTTITPGSTHTVNAISINGSSTGVAGQPTMLMGGGGSGWILAGADF